MNKAVLRKILCNYVAVLHCQTWCWLTCDIRSHLFSTRTERRVLKCDAFETLNKSHQCCSVVKVAKTFGAILTSFLELSSKICQCRDIFFSHLSHSRFLLCCFWFMMRKCSKWTKLPLPRGCCQAVVWRVLVLSAHTLRVQPNETTTPGWRSSLFSFKLNKYKYLPNLSSLSRLAALTVLFIAVGISITFLII